MIRGYDQWKTASPYDNEEDCCPRCGANYEAKDYPGHPEEDLETDWYNDGFCSKECFDEYKKDPNYDGVNMSRYKRITKEQREYLATLEDRARKAMDKEWEKARDNHITIEEVFDCAPDGDFEWRDSEAGDWHVFACGNKDCPVGWHRVAYAMDISRKNDKKFIELRSVDEDGNWDFGYGWESGEDPYEVLFSIAVQMPEYFYGWFQYWAECAYTGKDVLDEADDPTVENFIKFAEEELKYLEK